MASRRNANSLAAGHGPSLQSFICAGRAVLQQASRGSDPVLAPPDLIAAEQSAVGLWNNLHAPSQAITAEVRALWAEPGQDAVAYMALLSLALRRASPSSAGIRAAHAYARIYDALFYWLARLGSVVGATPFTKLAPALLRTDVLECFARLLAEAASQLKAAVAASLAAQPGPPGAGVPPPELAVSGAGDTGSGREQQLQQQRPGLAEADERASVQQTAIRSMALARSTLRTISIVLVGPLGLSTGSGSSGGSSGGSSSAAAAPSPNDDPVVAAIAKLQSSWVLEHWAQVVLLGTAVLSSDGGGGQSVAASSERDEQLTRFCHMLTVSATGYMGFLRRPCGCALAATHMAQLCAALDGGDAFGAPKPEVLVLPASVSREFNYLESISPAAKKYDEVARRLGRAVNLHAAVAIMDAWLKLYIDGLGDMPCVYDDAEEGTGCQEGSSVGLASEDGDSTGRATAGHGGARDSDGGAPAGQEGAGDSATDAAPELSDAEGSSDADSSLLRLPPWNSNATFHLCLRLAKGVLACWGRPLSGVRLELPSRNPSAPAPLLPKEQSCALVHQALACARLALLPAVWGRERVPRRTRAQLRAWWETYVAAAQHPEMLAAGMTRSYGWPAWMCNATTGAS